MTEAEGNIIEMTIDDSTAHVISVPESVNDDDNDVEKNKHNTEPASQLLAVEDAQLNLKTNTDDDDDNDDDTATKVAAAGPVTPKPPTELQVYASWFMSDVLIYLTVINVAAEVSDDVDVSSFSFSILSSVILKVLLDVVIACAKARWSGDSRFWVISLFGFWCLVRGF